ncbi:MAG: HAD-IB family hydrolase [bacterium]|nr:HAD-IB family hydrolase [bacterium]
MSTMADLVREIEASPSGSHVGAFFDLDRTLIAGFSVLTFVMDGIVTGRIGATGLGLTMLAGLRFQLGQLPFSDFVTETLALLRGESEAAFRELGDRVFAERLAADLYPEARVLVAAHRRKGHTVAIVSSATPYQTDPVARELGIEHVLCTRLGVADGVFTGRIAGDPCYGVGKRVAAEALAGERGVEMAESFFYTDSDEDLPLLEAVGRPRPTNPNRGLAAEAVRRGWPQRTFTTRGLPGPVEVVRTGLALGSLVPSLLMGVPVAVLEGRWRAAINVAATIWGELGTGLAGIHLNVEGEEHLWARRPAVFTFNHQSAVETLLLCRLLRRDFVAIAKQEVKSNPFFGPVFALAGVVFIDRFNRERAIQALAPAVQALREGLSLAIAPEGTRSATGKLGAFKKGAFHLSIAAGVPIVPIVFRNTVDALPKHGIIARPSEIDVVVHPPIETGRLSVHDVDRLMAEVERLYQDTLASWSS